MNILLFHTGSGGGFPSAFRRKHSVVTAGVAGTGSYDIAYDPEHETIDAIFGRLPLGWSPDCCLLASVEAHDFPLRLEFASAPTVGLFSDYTLRFDLMRRAAPFIDLVVACDEALANRLRTQEANQVANLPGLGFDEETFRPLPYEKIYDICFVGNLHPQVQRHRTKLIEKHLLPLANRYRLFVGEVRGADYVRILNQSKIAFNYSTRGDLNARVFESMGCGALATLQDTHPAAPRFFRDREHIVYWNEDNLEDTLDYYLSHDAERERIAAAGHAEALAKHTWAHRVDAITELVQQTCQRGALPPRNAARFSPAERHVQTAAVHFYQERWSTATELGLDVLSAADGASPSLVTDAAVIVAQGIQAEGGDAGLTFEHVGPLLHRIWSRAPAYALAYFHFCMLAHQRAVRPPSGGAEAWETVRSLWEAFVAYLESEEVDPPHGIATLPSPERFHVEWEHALLSADPVRLKDLLRWKTYESLGDALAASHAWPEAARAYAQALEIVPDDGHLHRKQGHISERQGQIDDALVHYRLAAESEPLFFEAWADLAERLAGAGRADEAAAVCRRALGLASGLTTPRFAPGRLLLEQHLTKLGRQGEGTAARAGRRPRRAARRQRLAATVAVPSHLGAKRVLTDGTNPPKRGE